jgi:amino-acid N-acetyltransferase
MNFQMLEVKKLEEDETGALQHLLKSDQLCFNDINDQGVHLFGVHLNDELVGYFGYELFKNQALFRSMVVVPRARNKGYGSIIWNQAKEQMVTEGISDVYLLTNTAAPFFSKLGFEEMARASAPEPILATTEFKEFCPADSVCMKIKIS